VSGRNLEQLCSHGNIYSSSCRLKRTADRCPEWTQPEDASASTANHSIDRSKPRRRTVTPLAENSWAATAFPGRPARTFATIGPGKLRGGIRDQKENLDLREIEGPHGSFMAALATQHGICGHENKIMSPRSRAFARSTTSNAAPNQAQPNRIRTPDPTTINISASSGLPGPPRP
jgi:hypothetical protein